MPGRLVGRLDVELCSATYEKADLTTATGDGARERFMWNYA